MTFAERPANGRVSPWDGMLMASSLGAADLRC